MEDCSLGLRVVEDIAEFTKLRLFVDFTKHAQEEFRTVGFFADFILFGRFY